MSTGTALVNARTPNAVPGDQERGVYEYTPPEVIAYQRGEQLSGTDLQIVRNYFGGTLPAVNSHVAPQSPEHYPQAVAQSALAGQSVKPTQRRLVAKRVAGSPAPSHGTLTAEFVSSYVQLCPDEQAHGLLELLAKRFDLEIE